ncbi:MAG: MFS transporter [Bacteroidetes bacterium]|nr:MFS transporter [Bacteroidota bacterium]
MIARTISLYKTSFTGLSKETWLLSVVMLINRSGTMVVPFMTLYLTGKEMNRSLSDAGIVMALFGLGSVIGAYFGGKFTDKIGFHKVQLVTLFCGGILFIILGQLHSYPLICIFTFVLSFVNEAFRPANSSAVAFYSNPENRTRSYSLHRLSVNLGWAVGTSVGGLVASFSYELLFWIDGLTNIAAAAMLFIIFKNKQTVIKKDAKKDEIIPVQSAYKDKTYVWFIVLVTLFGLCFFQLFTTIPKYFRDNLYLSERFIGLLMAINGLLIVAIEMVLIYILEQKKKNMFFIRFGVILCALSFFTLLLPGNAKFITLLMIVFITIGEITSMPFMTSYWTSRSNENNRGQYAALYTIAWGIGQTLGPFLCSMLVDATNFKVLFIVLGSILFITAFGFYKLSKR